MPANKIFKLLFLTVAITPCGYAATLDKTLDVEGQTHQAARQIQQKVDELDSQKQPVSIEESILALLGAKSVQCALSLDSAAA